MSARRISKEAEDRILAALEQAIEYVNGGTGPSAAIVKAAAAADLPAGHVRLMVQAYNTGRTNFQRKSSTDIFEKSANFPLADPAAVLEELFPSNIKEAAAQAFRSTVVADEYNQDPSWIGQSSVMEKAALALPPMTARKPDAYPRDGSIRLKKAEGMLVSLEREREMARLPVSRALDKVAATIDDLDHYFRVAGRPATFKTIESNAAALWGRPAAIVMQKVAQANPFIPRNGRPDPGASMDVRREPYSLIKKALDAIEEYRKARAAFERFEKEATVAGVRLASRFLPPVPKVHRGSILKEFGPEKQAFASPFLSGMQNYGGYRTMEEIAGKLVPKSEDKLKTDAFLALEDPAHEARLRAIRAQAVLHDMLANDEYISSEDPHKVTRLYNEIIKLSPRAADQPMLMRALVRRYLAQGQVDPHDVDQLVGIETKMKMRDVPIRGSSSVQGLGQQPRYPDLQGR